MSEFEQLPLESPRSWLRRLEGVDRAQLHADQRRVLTYYMANAKRLLEQEQQRAKWDREKGPSPAPCLPAPGKEVGDPHHAARRQP
jgi:hypothetical protein